MTINPALFSFAAGDWGTPKSLFALLHHEFKFTLDAAATKANALTKRFITPQQDAFAQDWAKLARGGAVWLNPPYGREVGRWIEQALAASCQGATVVVLLPARTDTRWFHELCRYGEVRLLRGRLKFVGAPTSAPFPSLVVVFGPTVKPTVKLWAPTL